MNIQELQTIKHHQLPVKLFVLNNGGYLSMRSHPIQFLRTPHRRQPRQRRLLSRLRESWLRLRNSQPAHRSRRRLAPGAGRPGPARPRADRSHARSEQEFEPRPKSKQLPDGKIVTPPLEDMYPFLDPDELAAISSRMN